MSAASSWMTSAAVPPTKFVSSLSCTEFTSTGTISTWMSLWDEFHDSTMLFVAATVVGCHTYVANLSWTVSRLPACAAVAASVVHSRITAPRPMTFLIWIRLSAVVAPSGAECWGDERSARLALDRPREEAAREPALDEGEEDEARSRREQRRRRERAEPDDALDADELREPERQRRQLGRLEDDEREEELVPRRDEREKRRHDDAGREQRSDDPDDDLKACRPVDRRRLLDVARDRTHVA